MTILSICDNPDVLSMFRVIKILLTIVRIVVPIMLIISLALDFTKATIDGNNDSLKKASTLAVTKAIAAILVFFIPNFVHIVVNVVSGDDTYEQCLSDATIEKISAGYETLASSYMDMVKENYNESYYNLALKAVNKIKDEDLKKKKLDELKDIKAVIDAKKYIDIVRKSKNTTDYENAEAAIEKIKDETIKSELSKELEEISYSMTQYIEEYSSNGLIANAAGMPYYNQCDSRWGNHAYDITAAYTATLCSSSCGYTSFSMVASGLNHDMSINPLGVVQFFRGTAPTHKGYGAMSDAELRDANKVGHFNLVPEVLFGRSSDMSETKKVKIMTAINAGKPVVLLTPGHFVALAPSGTGKVVLLDPFYTNKNGTYTVDQLYSKVGTFMYAVAYSRK